MSSNSLDKRNSSSPLPDYPNSPPSYDDVIDEIKDEDVKKESGSDGFEYVWDYFPHVSLYQLKIICIAGYVCIYLVDKFTSAFIMQFIFINYNNSNFGIPFFCL